MARSGSPGDDARWRVFVSHTSELRDFPKAISYVAAVERAVPAAGHVVVDMAGFPAAGQAPARVCAERVRGCDVYVGVLGTRYGSAGAGPAGGVVYGAGVRHRRLRRAWTGWCSCWTPTLRTWVSRRRR